MYDIDCPTIFFLAYKLHMHKMLWLGNYLENIHEHCSKTLLKLEEE
jgi:hypothetical protein